VHKREIILFVAASFLIVLNQPVMANGSMEFLKTLRDAAYSYPLTRSAGHGVDAADSEKAAADWQRFPTVSVVSSSPSNTGNGANPLLNVPVNSLVLTQPIWAGGGIDAGINYANARYSSSQAYYQQVVQEIAIKTVNTWYEWQRSQARQAVLKDSVEALRKLKEQMERRAEKGVSPDADLTLAVARLSQAQSDFAQVQSATRTAYAQLVQLTGAYLSQFTLFADAADPEAQSPPPSEWRLEALARDPLLLKLSSDMDVAAADIKVQRSKMYPTVSVRLQKDFSGPTAGSGIFLQVSGSTGAGLSLAAGVDAAIARSDAAADARRDAELELERTLDVDISDNASSRDQLAVAELLRSSTQEVAESYARQFVAGRKNWFEVLNAVREAVSARLSIIDAQALVRQTWWRLRIRSLGLVPQTGAAL
jgi:adhesin transport system outer membrane protein